jgi:hypothetical protein
VLIGISRTQVIHYIVFDLYILRRARDEPTAFFRANPLRGGKFCIVLGTKQLARARPPFCDEKKSDMKNGACHYD